MSITSKCVTRNEYWVECNLCGGRASQAYSTHLACDDRTTPVLQIIFRGRSQRIDLCPGCVHKLGFQLDRAGVSLGSVVELAIREAAMDPPKKCNCTGSIPQQWSTQTRSWYCGYCKGWVDPVQP